MTEITSLAFKNNKKSRGSSKNSQKSVLERRIVHIERQLATRVVNPKYIVTNFSAGTLVNGTPISVCVNAVVQGTDEVNRIGDICKMQWIEFSLDLTSAAGFIAGAFPVRAMLVSETTSLGAAASFAQLFTSATPTALTMRNYTTRDDKRFHVWWDSGPLLLGPTAFAVNTAVNQFGAPSGFEIVSPRISLNNLRSDYSRGNAGTVADIDTNALSFMLFTGNTNANYITYSVSSVVQFLD